MGGGRNDYNFWLGLSLVGLGVAGVAIRIHQAVKRPAYRIFTGPANEAETTRKRTMNTKGTNCCQMLQKWRGQIHNIVGKAEFHDKQIDHMIYPIRSLTNGRCD